MLIRCPECRFERQIDENAIPANAAMATCPHCQYRFRFRNPDGTPVADETPAAAPAPQTAPAGRPLPPDLDGDDPLPPGAMVPVFRATMTPPRRLPRPPKPSPKRASRNPRKTLRKSAPTSGTISRRNATGKARGKGGIAAAMHVDGTDVPWEEPKRYNLFMALYQTILRVMFNAPRFFAALPATNGKLTRPARVLPHPRHVPDPRRAHVVPHEHSGQRAFHHRPQIAGSPRRRGTEHEPAPDHPPDAGHPCHPALFLRVGLLPHAAARTAGKRPVPHGVPGHRLQRPRPPWSASSRWSARSWAASGSASAASSDASTPCACRGPAPGWPSARSTSSRSPSVCSLSGSS